VKLARILAMQFGGGEGLAQRSKFAA